VKKTLVKIIVGGGLILAATQALGSRTYYSNNYTTLDAIVEVAQEETSQSAYTRAYVEKNADEKIRLLEAFIANPKWKGAKEQKNAYSELALVYLNPRGNYDEAMENATKALSFSDLEAEYQVRMYLTLSACYYYHPAKKDMNKGSDLANKAFDIASANQSAIDPAYLNAAKQLKDAFAKELAPKIKKAPVVSPLEQAIKLYNQKKYTEADKAFSSLDQGDANVAYYSGLSAFQLKNYSDAVNHLITASLLGPAKYAKEKEHAYGYFVHYVYHESKTGKDCNTLSEEKKKAAKAEIQKLTDALNAKWAGKDVKEGSATERQYKTEFDNYNASCAQINKDANDFNALLKKTADAAFEKLVSDAKKRIGK